MITIIRNSNTTDQNIMSMEYSKPDLESSTDLKCKLETRRSDSGNSKCESETWQSETEYGQCKPGTLKYESVPWKCKSETWKCDSEPCKCQSETWRWVSESHKCEPETWKSKLYPSKVWKCGLDSSSVWNCELDSTSEWKYESERWKRESEPFIGSNDEDFCTSFLESHSRVFIQKPNSHGPNSSKNINKKIENSTSSPYSESSTNSDSEAITDSYYSSSQDSLELSSFDGSTSTTSDEFEDFSASHSSEDQTVAEFASSTSDTYDSSDNETSHDEEFFDSSSCSVHNETQALDQSTERKSMNCTNLLPNADSNTTLPTTKTSGSAGSNEQESENNSSLFESHEKSDYFSQGDFSNLAEMVDADSTTAKTRDKNVNLKVDTDADSIDNPTNFFAEEQCWMRLDILLRLKEMLHEIVNDYKKYGAEVCTDIEKRMKEIIKDNENLLKEQVPPKLLEKIEDQLTQSKSDELENPAPGSKEISRISESAYSNWNYDEKCASDSDTSDSCDHIDSSEEFKKFFDKYQSFIGKVKLGKTQTQSWKDGVSMQQRKNWAESIAYTAATQVELKPGKEIDHEGLKRFGESIEWEVFHCQANSAVEYSNMLCDIHSEIGHGQMAESEREYLMFLAHKK